MEQSSTMTFTNQQIDVSQLPKMEDIAYQPLEIVYKKLLFIRYITIWGIPLIASVVAFFLLDKNKLLIGISAGIFGVVLPVVLLLINKIYRLHGYALREKDVCQRSGLFFRKYDAVPFRRIQHLSVEQGVIARKLNLAALHIHTAAGDEGEMILNGLTKEQAEDMKAYILNIIKEHAEN